MSNGSDRVTFAKAYAGKVPWDTGQPAGVLVAVADQVTGPVLDAGCGTGDTALFFAGRGLRVTGIDFVEEAIRRARAKAAGPSLAAEFLVKDALTLGDWGERFASVIDCGLFHVFSRNDRRRYVAGLARVLEPGGRLFLACGSTEETRDIIPRVSRQELYDAFADGWEVESVEAVRYELSPEYHFPDGRSAEGGARGWFAVIRRNG
jgi:cyclopropane fatty-acyl-phospholipid synthase-like methyltransferase